MCRDRHAMYLDAALCAGAADLLDVDTSACIHTHRTITRLRAVGVKQHRPCRCRSALGAPRELVRLYASWDPTPNRESALADLLARLAKAAIVAGMYTKVMAASTV